MFILYLLIINAVGFLLMLSDKKKAIKKQWRIPESVLIGFAVFGGSIGEYLGMKLFRHKTKHLLFSLGLPILMTIHIVLAVISLIIPII